MVLIATAEHLELMCDRAEQSYPQECCGLLLGRLSAADKQVVEVVPTENCWDDRAAAVFGEALGTTARAAAKERSFAIAPEVLLRVQKQARDRGLNVIGIYHSHPDSPARPSDFDRALAWAEYSYPIISVACGKASALLSWTLDEAGNFQPEAIARI